jgi:hypothetical protein
MNSDGTAAQGTTDPRAYELHDAAEIGGATLARIVERFGGGDAQPGAATPEPDDEAVKRFLGNVVIETLAEFAAKDEAGGPRVRRRVDVAAAL